MLVCIIVLYYTVVPYKYVLRFMAKKTIRHCKHHKQVIPLTRNQLQDVRFCQPDVRELEYTRKAS